MTGSFIADITGPRGGPAIKQRPLKTRLVNRRENGPSPSSSATRRTYTLPDTPGTGRAAPFC